PEGKEDPAAALRHRRGQRAHARGSRQALRGHPGAHPPDRDEGAAQASSPPPGSCAARLRRELGSSEGGVAPLPNPPKQVAGAQNGTLPYLRTGSQRNPRTATIRAAAPHASIIRSAFPSIPEPLPRGSNAANIACSKWRIGNTRPMRPNTEAESTGKNVPEM